MAFDIRVPEFGESVSEAIVGRWLKKVGDVVAIDDAVVELETDKVAIEITAEQAGTLETVVQAEGATVKVGDVLATLGSNTPASSVTMPIAVRQAATVATPASANGASVTPVARRVAGENDVDLGAVTGTGPGGRITKDDINGHLHKEVPAESIPALTAPMSASRLVSLLAPTDREERIPLTRRRKTIATRLVEAQHSAAMLTTFNEVDMSAIMDIRKRHKETFKERHGIGLGFMSFFTKATVGALKAFPRLNAEIQGDDMVLKRHYDIGIAVGAEEGLVVPVLRDADRKTFADIEQDISDMAGRARQNKLTLAELQGGTFTITNGGVFGSLLSTPILNAPEVAILGMHKIQERAVVVEGQVVARPMMYLALSYDHRLVDGREAVQFLVRLKDLLEAPETLMLEA